MLTRLETLYEIQIIDEQLDELEELRGDLPLAVNELNSRMAGINELISVKEDEKNYSLEKIKDNESEIERLNENLKKFKAQLYQVRNNKEYDALTKEIDHSEVLITGMENENLELELKIEKLKNEITEVAPQFDKFKNELTEKEENLKQIIEANQREDEKLKSLRDVVAEKIKKPDYNTYMRIRKAKGGVAVSTIERAACSGCHNVVPSQRQLEIKQNKRIFTCEACGRMLVSADIAAMVKRKL